MSAARKAFEIAVSGNLTDAIVIAAAAINAAPTSDEGWERAQILMFRWQDTARFYLTHPTDGALSVQDPPKITAWICPEGHVQDIHDENFPPDRARVIAMMNARFANDRDAYGAAFRAVGTTAEDRAELVWLMFELTSSACAVAIKGLEKARQDVLTQDVLRKHGVLIDGPDHAPMCTNSEPHERGEGCSR